MMSFYCNDPIKHPVFFKHSPQISAQVISSMFNKRPALIKCPPYKGGHLIRDLFENFAFL